MRYVLFIIVTAVSLSVTLFLRREPILQAIGDWLIIQDELHPADVIHVIAGAGEDYRTDYGIQLYKQGYGKQIFFTGGWCTFHNLYHGQHGRELALQQGVPSEAIVIDDSDVVSTYSEAVRLKEFLAQNRATIRSVIVVSDPFHMRRARWTYRRLLGSEIRVQMAPVPFESSPYQRRWWTHKVSRRYVRDEYLKISYYYARYQFNLGPLNGWLVSLDRD